MLLENKPGIMRFFRGERRSRFVSCWWSGSILVCLFLTAGLWRQHSHLVKSMGPPTNRLETFLPSTVMIRTGPVRNTRQNNNDIMPPYQKSGATAMVDVDVDVDVDTSGGMRTVYSYLRKDQSGWAIFDMLKAHAYAHARNVTYGGACGNSTHRDDVQAVLTAVGWKDILPLACPPTSPSFSSEVYTPTTTPSSFRIYDSAYFEKKHGRRMADPTWRAMIQSHTDYTYFDGSHINTNTNTTQNASTTATTTRDESISNPFVASKQMSSTEEKDLNSTKPPPPSSSTTITPFSIVVHIRRRDVTPCCYPGWYLPNSYFISMIEKYYQRHHHHGEEVQEVQTDDGDRASIMRSSTTSILVRRRSDVTVHIFSQSDSQESWEDFQNDPRYKLQLDGPVGDVWRAILSADVFVGSISEFSRVPALFAQGEIPDPHNISDPIIAAATQTENQRLLDQCTEMQLLQCKHKWWMTTNTKKRSFPRHTINY